jgi:hypothetical protein
MKIRLIKRNDAGAVVMTAAICIFAVSTLLVVGYLWLVMGQSKLVAESQNWNHAMTVTEAGVEEAMAQLNWGPQEGRGDLSANGWTAVATSTPGLNYYGPPGERTLEGGSYYASFIAPVSPILTNGARATIYSTGMVTAPMSGRLISRRVMVTAMMEPRFHDAIDVVSNMTANGNGPSASSVTTDSWNSQTNTLSTNGQYDPNKVSTNGGVGAEFGTVNLGNHTIHGNLYLGANADYTSSVGQVKGTIYDDYNVEIADAQLPDGNWQDAVTTTVYQRTTNVIGGFTNITTTSLGTGYNFTNSGNYRITKSGGAHPIFIAPNVNVNLDVQLTTFNASSSNSSSAVTIQGGVTNAGTVNIYQESGTATLGMANGTYRPANFEYYGLPGVTDVTMSFSGNTSFVGVIYAPGVNLKLNGGGSGSSLTDISGALVVHSFTMGGHYGVHFDESLLIYGPTKGFVATSWREF